MRVDRELRDLASVGLMDHGGSLSSVPSGPTALPAASGPFNPLSQLNVTLCREVQAAAAAAVAVDGHTTQHNSTCGVCAKQHCDFGVDIP